MSVDSESGRLLADAAERARRYLADVDNRRVAPAPAALDALATAWDQNTALPVMSPVAARLHEVVTGWATTDEDIERSAQTISADLAR